jgi:hypothetical protein
MDLAWLASVLRPRDVALHPDFDEERNTIAPAFLAAVVLGDDWRLRRLVDVNDLHREIELPDPAIGYVRDTFSAETREHGLAELSRILLDNEPEDPARSCALTLLASCAAAELDDYDTCDKLLDYQLRWTVDSDLSDDRLIQAVLLQQKSLRLLDSGRPHQEISAAALRLLTDLDVMRCGSFTLSQSVSWSSGETLRQIALTVRDAAYSLVSDREINERSDFARLGRERLRDPEMNYVLESDQRASRQYTNFVIQLFNQRFLGPDTRSIGGAEPGLFYVTLALELAGHGQVYRSRLEWARLRMVQAVPTHDSTGLADVVRLFRQAASKRDIDLTLNWLRASGPLEALTTDARQIIERRSLRERLRSVELRVLTAAAEVLTEEEAGAALDAVLMSLNSGGPPDLPGEWELKEIRLQSAWRAAAALANTAGRMNEIAGRLLDESAKINADQIRDRAVASAASLVEWNNVSLETKQLWRNYLLTNGDKAPIVLSVMAPILGKSAMAVKADHPSLDVIATWLNISLRGDAIDPQILDAAIPQVRNAMVETKEAAKRGSFSLGSATGDIAAALIIYAGAVELWPDLVGFLKDPAVSRVDRSPAFERLARDARDVPLEIRRELEIASDSVLETPDRLFSQGITPYPEALRLYGMLGVIADNKLLDLTARLAGLGDEGRREAAKTLASLSRTASSPWIFGFATQLSYDDDVETRASAGRSLTQLAASSSEIATLAGRRLVDLLKEDGLLVPAQVLRGLKEFSSRLTDDIRVHIEWMRDNHPSRTIRRGAMDVLDSGDNISDGKS